MEVHLVDGTYELFRHFFALPSAANAQGQEVAATRGVVASVLGMLADGATHLGVATDHVIESFRNDLYPSYKTGEGIEPALLSQFTLLETTLAAAGIKVWPMIEHEADDALATAAAIAARDERVSRVWICTPDKDLAQSVVGGRVVQHDRRRSATIDEEGVQLKFGVPPASIPDLLALVGDSADGYPGLPGWGARSAAEVLARYRTIEAIPERFEAWDVKPRAGARLAATLVQRREEALLFRRLARLVTDVPGLGGLDEWRWRGPTASFSAVCAELEAPQLAERAERIARSRATAAS
jgi:5'-3' exonuclease